MMRKGIEEDRIQTIREESANQRVRPEKRNIPHSEFHEFARLESTKKDISAMLKRRSKKKKGGIDAKKYDEGWRRTGSHPEAGLIKLNKSSEFQETMTFEELMGSQFSWGAIARGIGTAVGLGGGKKGVRKIADKTSKAKAIRDRKALMSRRRKSAVESVRNIRNPKLDLEPGTPTIQQNPSGAGVSSSNPRVSGGPTYKGWTNR